MDLLSRAMHDHGQLTEQMALFQEASPIIRMSRDYDQVLAFTSFINRYIIAHFKFEETEIFPVLEQNGDVEIRKFVASLVAEHNLIVAMAEEYFMLLEEAQLPPSSETIEKLSGLGTKIMNQALAHARNEDEKLFPIMAIMKRYFQKK